MKETLKVGVAGVRGVVGQSMTPQLASAFAQAFGTFVGRGTVLVGRDSRPSGHMLELAVASGLQSVGCKPVLAGVVPTPTLLLLTKALQAHGGIAITASHNAAEWNALKFIGQDGLFLSPAHAEELFDIYHQQAFPLVPETEIPSVATEPYPTERHFQAIMRYVNRRKIQQRRFKVAIDCCNGVGAVHTPFFLTHFLGCDIVPIFDTPSGVFEREPEPLPQHLGPLGEAVVKGRCDVGFAQDPDGDRLALVDETGRPIGEDMTLAFAIRQVLEAHRRGPVAINLLASRAVEQVALDRGVDVQRTKIGETNVTEQLLRMGAVVGGEDTGGVIIPDIHPCRDSFAAMAVILELMADTGKAVSQLRAEVPEFHVARHKIPIGSDQSPAVLRTLRKLYAGRPLNLLDGVGIDFDEARVHVRRSNTEPILRIYAEARRPDLARKYADQLKTDVEQAIRL